MFCVANTNLPTHLETVTPIRFSVDDVKNLILDTLAHGEALCPIVRSSCIRLVYEEVLWVVDVLVSPRFYAIDHLPLR